MRQLGRKQLTLQLQERLATLPTVLEPYRLTLDDDGMRLTYNYDTQGERTGITALLGDLSNAGIRFKDLSTTQNSLEDIFVSLVRRGA
jgi:ABC-2 type transport system ATP-binding protein